MVKYISSITVPFARDRVWALLSDWSNLSAWDMSITQSILAPSQKSDKVGVGTKYNVLFTANGMKNVKVEYVCSVFDAPNRCQHIGTATLFRSQDTFQFDVVSETETKITAEFNLSFRCILAPLSFLMNGTMQETGPIVMKDIDKFVHEQLDEKKA